MKKVRMRITVSGDFFKSEIIKNSKRGIIEKRFINKRALKELEENGFCYIIQFADFIV